MTLELALRLAHEVHLDVSDVGAAAQEVVPHQAVEVVGRGSAGVGLEVHNLGLLLDDGGQFAGDARGFLERSPSGMSMMTWNSLLLSNGSIFTLTNPTPTRRYRAEQHRRDQRQKAAARSGVMEQRIHHATVEAGEAVLAFPLGVAGGAAEDPDGGPRRHHQGGDQREEHGGRCRRWGWAACRDPTVR